MGSVVIFGTAGAHCRFAEDLRLGRGTSLWYSMGRKYNGNWWEILFFFTRRTGRFTFVACGTCHDDSAHRLEVECAPCQSRPGAHLRRASAPFRSTRGTCHPQRDSEPFQPAVRDVSQPAHKPTSLGRRVHLKCKQQSPDCAGSEAEDVGVAGERCGAGEEIDVIGRGAVCETAVLESEDSGVSSPVPLRRSLCRHSNKTGSGRTKCCR